MPLSLNILAHLGLGVGIRNETTFLQAWKKTKVRTWSEGNVEELPEGDMVAAEAHYAVLAS